MIYSPKSKAIEHLARKESICLKTNKKSIGHRLAIGLIGLSEILDPRSIIDWLDVWLAHAPFALINVRCKFWYRSTSERIIGLYRYQDIRRISAKVCSSYPFSEKVDIARCILGKKKSIEKRHDWNLRFSSLILAITIFCLFFVFALFLERGKKSLKKSVPQE